MGFEKKTSGGYKDRWGAHFFRMFFFSDTGVPEVDTDLFNCTSNNITLHMKNRLGIQLFELIYRAHATIVGDMVISMIASVVHKSVLILVHMTFWTKLVDDIHTLSGSEKNSDGSINFFGIPITVQLYQQSLINALRNLDPNHIKIAWSPETINHIAVLEIDRANREVMHAMPPTIFAKFTNAQEKMWQLDAVFDAAFTMLTF